MIIKKLIDEDFQNYKKPSMFIGMPNCNFKCAREQGLDISICQNSEITKERNVEVSSDVIIKRYLKNPITKAIVFGGLEPFLSFKEMKDFIEQLRKKTEDDIIIYTGYYPVEIKKEIEELKNYKNIIIKFGRYIPDMPSKYDPILGVELHSNNQFAQQIS